MSYMEVALRLQNTAADRVRERIAASADSAALFLRRAAEQRELAQLSERQLDDAGVDRSLAGRGKAAEVSAAALRRLESLAVRMLRLVRWNGIGATTSS
jgi:uncharacterized protein YjiS (DUF1127 family)